MFIVPCIIVLTTLYFFVESTAANSRPNCNRSKIFTLKLLNTLNIFQVKSVTVNLAFTQWMRYRLTIHHVKIVINEGLKGIVYVPFRIILKALNCKHQQPRLSTNSFRQKINRIIINTIFANVLCQEWNLLSLQGIGPLQADCFHIVKVLCNLTCPPISTALLRGWNEFAHPH